MTRITPFRFTILHLSQIFLTDALTFIFFIQLFRKLDLAFQIPLSVVGNGFKPFPTGISLPAVGREFVIWDF